MADLTITEANVATGAVAGKSNVTLSLVQAGEAITRSQPIKYDSTDGKYYQATGDTAANADAVGVSLTSAAAVDDSFVLVLYGPMKIGAIVVVDTAYAVSATKGKIMPSGDFATGNYITFLGVAISTTEIMVAPAATGNTHA